MITANQCARWSVRGVSHDARIRAKKAAQRRPVTIGERVSQALIAVADEERAGEPEYLMPAGLTQNAASAAGFGACEHAPLALMNRPPPPKDNAAQEQQAPWSIRGVNQVARVRPAGEPAKPEDRLSEAELAFWEAIKDSANPEDYEAYLETFPGGVFASLARKRAMRAAAPRPGGPEQQPGAPGPSASGRQPGQPGRAPVVSSPWLDFDRLNERAQQNTERSKRKMEKLKRERALISRQFRDRDTHSRPIRRHPTTRPRWAIMAWMSATRLAKACCRSSGGKLLRSVLFRRLGAPASRPSVSNYARRAFRRSRHRSAASRSDRRHSCPDT